LAEEIFSKNLKNGQNGRKKQKKRDAVQFFSLKRFALIKVGWVTSKPTLTFSLKSVTI